MTRTASYGVRWAENFFRCWVVIAAVGAIASIVFWLFEPMFGSNQPLAWRQVVDLMLRGPAILMSLLSAPSFAVLSALLAVVLAALPWPPLTPVIAATAFYFTFYAFQLKLLETAANAMSSPKEDAPNIWSNEWLTLNADAVHATKVIGLAGSIVVFMSLAILVKKSAKELSSKSDPV